MKSTQKQTYITNKKNQKLLKKVLTKTKTRYIIRKKGKEKKKKMKRLKIVNKTKFYKTMLSISLYINFLMILGVMWATGLLSKILDYIFIIY